MYRILAESIVSDTPSSVKYATEDVVAASFATSPLGTSFDAKGDRLQLIRSASDKFNYRLIQLQNGIRILLISDPSYSEFQCPTGSNASSQENVNPMKREHSEDEQESSSESDSDDESMATQSSSSQRSNDKLSAFVIGVDVGSFKDPRDFPGMAHMLEHMMSMGSEAFPEENEIDKFLSSRGGYQNAHTECDYTCYEIKVHRRYLKEAINLFGKAFVSPLMRKKSIEREIHPVDTEFIEASSDDDSRVELLLGHLANSDHPLNQFLWGNRKSLYTDPKEKGLDLQKALIEFFNTHYKPENIVVVVQSQESLDNLQDWTVDVFSEVKVRGGLPQVEIAQHNPKCLPFENNSRFNQLYLMESIQSGSRLLIHWCFPSVLDKYLYGPLDYLSTLIGHEGKGSLIAELRKRDLATDLVTDSEYFCFKNNRLSSIFSIDIELTDIGSARLDEVVQLLFEYLAVIRKAGAQEYFFLEHQNIALKSFNNKSERSALSYSISLMKNLLNYPVQHLLTGHNLYYYFNKEAINEYLSKLLPQTANFIHVGGEIKADLPILHEPWMETKYQVMPIPPKWLQAATQCTGISAHFHYPESNPFIATKFDLVRDTLPENAAERKVQDFPVKIYDSLRMIVWHKADFKFNLPKAAIHIHIMSPWLDSDLENVTLSDVLFEYVLILLKEDTYDALIAGLNWEITRTFNGIYLHATGFNHKLANLVHLLLERFKTVEFNEKFLESIKEKVVKFYNNDYQEPDTFNKDLRYSILMERYFTFLERWTQIDAISKERLNEYKRKFLSNLSFEMLAQGNITINETLDLSKQIKRIFDLEGSQVGLPYEKRKTQVVKLPPGCNKIRALTLTQKSRISHVVCYYQLETFDFHSSSYLSLFIELINELCFNTLRTEEGLGYYVGCSENDTFGILGFNVFVSSDADKFDCTHIQSRIEQFLDMTCREYVMEKLSQDKFEEFVSSAIKRKGAPDLSLGQEVKRHMDEINSFDYCFQRVKREIAHLRQATLHELRQWTLKHVFLPADKRKLLVIEVVGNGSKSLEECATLKGEGVNELMIPNDGQCKPLQLLQTKNGPTECFIKSVDLFKKRLSMYPSQGPDVHCQ